MARVFISPLGATDYHMCKYHFADTNASYKTRFIQEASVRHYCKGWSTCNGDRIKILCTEKSEVSNWLDDGHCERDSYNKPTTVSKKQTGLKTALSQALSEPDYCGLLLDKALVHIPEGKDESEVWDIFAIMCDLLHEGDEVYFDITHGFRSIPMLVLTVIPYMKALSDLTVCKISYGAFEAKYNSDDGTETHPVFDLTDFSTLMDWTNAAQDFIDYGQTTRLVGVLNKQLSPFLAMTNGKDPDAATARNIASGIKKLSQNIARNDLAAIIGFSRLRQNLTELQQQGTRGLKAFAPLLKKVEQKVASFKKDDIGNVFAAARWCFSHQMYQNAYSILLEGLISIVLKLAGEEKITCCEGDSKEIRGIVEEKRKLLSLVAKLQSGILDTSGIHDWAKPYDSLMLKMKALFTEDIARKIVELNDYRNAFMHAGTGVPLPCKLISFLEECLPCLESWYTQISNSNLTTNKHVNI